MVKFALKMFGKNNIRTASVILAFTLLVSNILGVIRDHFLAQKIPTALLDTYFASFRLPDFVFNILILGAVSAAFIPLFSGLVAKGKVGQANRFASNTLSVGLVIILIILGILYFLIPMLIPWLVPSFEPTRQITTIKLSRLFLLSPVFFACSYLLGGILQSYKRFLVASLAPIVYNLAIIVGTIFFSDRYGVIGVGYSVVVGAFLHMLIQVLPLSSLGVRLHFVFDIRSKILRKLGQRMLPRAIALGGNSLLLMGFTMLASGMSKGAVAIYSLADNIQTMPTVVFGTSVATALFPTLAQTASLKKKEDFSRYLGKAIVTILFFLIPSSAGILILRAQIIRLILGSGHFGWEQTLLASQTLGFFAISLAFSGLIPLLSRAFYSLSDTKTPMFTTIISVIITLIIAFGLSRVNNVSGLALAFSLGVITNVFLLWGLLKARVGKFTDGNFSLKMIKIFGATLVMGFLAQATKGIIGGYLSPLDRFWEVALQAVGATIIGIIVYLPLIGKMGLSIKKVTASGSNRLQEVK